MSRLWGLTDIKNVKTPSKTHNLCIFFALYILLIFQDIYKCIYKLSVLWSFLLKKKNKKRLIQKWSFKFMVNHSVTWRNSSIIFFLLSTSIIEREFNLKTLKNNMEVAT
jgi:hypothetical protein